MVAAVGIVLLVFIFMCFFAYRINSDRFSAEERSMTENQCLRLSNIISEIYLASPGAEFNITLDCNTTFESEKGMAVKSENMESFCHSSIPFTNGTEERFMLEKGNISLRNVNGNIMIGS